MIKASLYFQIVQKYDQKSYEPLKRYGTVSYDNVKKGYVWTFPVKFIKEVMAVIGKPFIIEGDEAHLVEHVFVNKKKDVIEKKKQGVGFTSVALHPKKPNYFVVTTVREKKPQNTFVSFDTVEALWRVVKRQPLNRKILTHTIAKNYCEELKIIAFNTHKDDTFNWKYFSGSRKYYLVFYAAIKVLANYNAVEHIVQGSRSGIERLKDVWTIQTVL